MHTGNQRKPPDQRLWRQLHIAVDAMIRALDNGFEFDVDRAGAATTSFSSPSAASCQTDCTKNVQCRAFSWVSSTSTCWIKSSMRGVSFNDNVTSGLPKRYLSGFDTPGNDLSNFSSTNLAHCANECARTAACNAFTLNLGNNRCYLKGAVGTWSANANCTSGVRRAFEPDTDRVGGDMSSFSTSSETVCADTCATTLGCVAWTLRGARNSQLDAGLG